MDSRAYLRSGSGLLDECRRYTPLIFSFALSDEYWRDFAEIADVEACIINKDTDYEQFRKELRWNEVYYMLNKSLR